MIDIAGEVRPSAGHGPHERIVTTHRLFGGDRGQFVGHDPARLFADSSRPDLTAWFCAGSSDHSGTRSAQTLYRMARRSGANATLDLGPGRHSFAYVHDIVSRHFSALADRLTAPTTSALARERSTSLP